MVGSQPNFSFAFVGSPNNDSTSAGRKYLSSVLIISLARLLQYPTSPPFDHLKSIESPKYGAAFRIKSFTEYCTPVAMT